MSFRTKASAVAVAAAQGYDSLYLLKAAIEQAKSTDGTAIKNALENLRTPFNGITAWYERPFTPTDHEAVTESMVKTGVVFDGTVVPQAVYNRKLP